MSSPPGRAPVRNRSASSKVGSDGYLVCRAIEPDDAHGVSLIQLCAQQRHGICVVISRPSTTGVADAHHASGQELELQAVQFLSQLSMVRKLHPAIDDERPEAPVDVRLTRLREGHFLEGQAVPLESLADGGCAVLIAEHRSDVKEAPAEASTLSRSRSL